ncbi:cartilage intermediate layer protein 1-like [Glandiceps talaboti]
MLCFKAAIIFILSISLSHGHRLSLQDLVYDIDSEDGRDPVSVKTLIDQYIDLMTQLLNILKRLNLEGEWESGDTTVTPTSGTVNTPPPYIPEGTGWMTWGEWSSCDVTCGNGTRTRVRQCYSGSSDDTCVGNSQRTRPCNEGICPDCSKVCSRGILDDNCLFCVCENVDVSGTVTDVSGRPLEGVKVYRAENRLTAEATTDSSGSFTVTEMCGNGDVLIFSKENFVDVERRLDSSASVQVTLQRIRPLFITEHPQSKVRLVGSAVTMCCKAKSYPEPEYYEWFKDGDILDQTVYNYNNTLTIHSLIEDDTGTYTCRANSEVGSQYSMPASLNVIESAALVCSSTPDTKLMTLPDVCQGGAESQYYDIGKCSGNKCPLDTSGECIDSQSYCCNPSSTETRTVVCSDIFTLQITVVTACGCTPCGKQTIKVQGRAEGADNGRPLRYGEVFVEKERVDRTNHKGDFMFEVQNGKTRISVTFKDTVSKIFVDTTKVFTLSEDTVVYHKVFLQRRAPTITIDSTEDSTVPLGGDPDQSNAELEIPAGSFYKADGTPFTGNVEVSLTQTNLTDESAVNTIQSDLSTRDVEGNQIPLQTYGMFSMKFTDEDNSPLRVDGDMKLYIDAEKTNIDTTADSLPRLWFLNEENGEWEDIGGLEVSENRRMKRQVQSASFLVGNINVVGYDLTSIPLCNIDRRFEQRQRWCFLKVKVYANERRSQPLAGATVTAVTNDLVVRDRTAPDFRRGRFSFFRSVTTGPDGTACLWTLCTGDGNVFSVNVRAEYGGKLLSPIHPSNAAVGGRTWPFNLLNTFQLPDRSPLRPEEYTGWITMRSIIPSGTSGPFYWQGSNSDKAKSTCKAAPDTNNQLTFVRNLTESEGLFEYETEDYDIDNFGHYERPRTNLSWYPNEGDDKKACFIKILVESATSERIVVKSLVGYNPDVIYGLRIDDSKADSTGSSASTAACIEFKCSGRIRNGDPYNTNYVGIDRTVLEIAPIPPSWTSCTLQGPPYLQANLAQKITRYGLTGDVRTENSRKLTFKLPYEESFDENTGIYTARGFGRTGYDRALANCYAGSDNAYRRPNPPILPATNWAIKYTCT